MAWCNRSRGTAFALAALLAAGAPGICHAAHGVISQAQSALRAKLRAMYPDVTRWRIDPLPEEWRASARIALLRIHRPIVLVTRLGTQSAVWVGTSLASSPPRGGLLWFQVAGYGTAVVAAHLIPAGAALEATDGELGQENILAAACRPLANPAALGGMRAVRLLRAGEIICAGAVQRMPPVARGQQVTARFSSHGVVVVTQVVAQGDGFLGEPVAVRNVSGGAVFSATVTGKGEVSVGD